MIYKMWPGRVPAGLVPNVRNYPCTSTASFKAGEPVIFSSGQILVAGTDPALVLGVALQDALTGLGMQAANSPATTTGVDTTNPQAAVAMADATTEFVAKMTNGSSTRIAVLDSYVGVEYGITVYSTVWTVDINKTTTSARVIVTGVNKTEGFCYFKFMPKFIYGYI